MSLTEPFAAGGLLSFFEGIDFGPLPEVGEVGIASLKAVMVVVVALLSCFVEVGEGIAFMDASCLLYGSDTAEEMMRSCEAVVSSSRDEPSCQCCSRFFLVMAAKRACSPGEADV